MSKNRVINQTFHISLPSEPHYWLCLTIYSMCLHTTKCFSKEYLSRVSDSRDMMTTLKVWTTFTMKNYLYVAICLPVLSASSSNRVVCMCVNTISYFLKIYNIAISSLLQIFRCYCY